MLDLSQQRRVEGVVRDLRLMWLSDDPLLACVESLERLFPGTMALIYQRDREGGFGGIATCVEGSSGRSWEAFPAAREQLPAMARYRLQSRDPFAFKPVTYSELYGNDIESIRRYQESLLAPQGYWYQLRITTYHDERFLALCGFLRSRRLGDFRRYETQMFSAVSSLICDSFVSMDVLGRARFSRSDLGDLLDALERPAFLVNGRGKRVYQNPRARALFPESPPWLSSASELMKDWERALPARLSQVDVEGESLWLVLPRQDAVPAEKDGISISLDLLTPRLRQVAKMLALGHSDKEIAQELEIEVSTARTYVTRVLRRLGVHSRRELIFALGSQGNDGLDRTGCFSTLSQSRSRAIVSVR
jgi:DNA-binding CsgD family transcriptional regulator